MDLFGTKRSFIVNWHEWRLLLDLAELFGWQPAGTIPNPSHEYPLDILYRPEPANFMSSEKLCGYFSNDGNMVTTPDAEALADALERALSHVNQPAVRSMLFKGSKSTLSNQENSVIYYWEHFRTEEEQSIMRFIKFCRDGRFIIM